MKAMMALVLGLAVAFPQVASGAFCLTSPDQPNAWYDRAGNKVTQELGWNRARQELVLYVAYSNDPSIYLRDQLPIDSFKLSFPAVRLDRSDRLYFTDKKGSKIVIGHLSSSGWGTGVALNDGVKIVAHRRDGVIHASLVSSGPGSR